MSECLSKLNNNLNRDYLEQMHGRKRLGAAPFIFTAYVQQSQADLLPDDRYTFVFVCKGSIVCVFASESICVKEGAVFVIDKQQMQSCTCSENTLLLEYVPIPRMVKFLKSTSNVFHMPYSELIPFNDQMSDWVYGLLEDYNSDKLFDGSFYHFHCQGLSKILLSYSKQVLGTLSVPLEACSIQKGGCDQCPMGETITGRRLVR